MEKTKFAVSIVYTKNHDDGRCEICNCLKSVYSIDGENAIKQVLKKHPAKSIGEGFDVAVKVFIPFK